MSFLKPAAGAMAATAPAANGAATGLGHLFGADPSRISSIADRIGTAANDIAAGGGAAPGYQQGAQQAPQTPQAPPNNYMQLTDPNVLRAIMAKFGPAQPQQAGVYR